MFSGFLSVIKLAVTYRTPKRPSADNIATQGLVPSAINNENLLSVEYSIFLDQRSSRWGQVNVIASLFTGQSNVCSNIRSEKTSKFDITGPLSGEPSGFSSQKASYMESVSLSLRLEPYAQQ